MKPLPATRLKAGQAIGAAEKLVDTFNWLVDATENLKGDGVFIYVDKSNPEVPAIELDIDSLQDFMAGQLSGLSGCSCEMSAELTSGTKIGSFTNDGWQTQVDLYAPSAVDGCSCDLSAELTSGTKIAAWTKDGTSWTNIYAPSGGGGDCSCSMSAVIGSETYQDAAYRTNTHIAQFKDCQGNTTNVYAPDSVRFQGNVGA